MTRRDFVNFVCLIVLLVTVAVVVPICTEQVSRLRIHRVGPPPTFQVR